jgi:hypothetical protein
MRVVEGFEVPFLDDFELADIVAAADVVGLAVAEGWQESGPYRLPKLHPDRPKIAAMGFDVLKGGAKSIRQMLAIYSIGSPLRADAEKLQFGAPVFYGYLRYAVKQIKNVELRRIFQVEMRGYAAEQGIFSRKGRPKPIAGRGSPLTLNEFAARLGWNPHRLRELAISLGLTHSEPDSTRHHSFSPQDVRAIRSVISDLVPRRKAASLACLTWDQFNRLSADGVFTPVLRQGSPTIGGDQFRSSQIKAWIRAQTHSTN